MFTAGQSSFYIGGWMRTILRWLVGTVVVTWRYLWMTTPLHRDERRGWSDDDLPPEIPDVLMDDQLRLAASGVGPMFHRCFRVHIVDAHCAPSELLAAVLEDFHRFVPREVVGIRRDEDGQLCVGQELVVEMPGPWDGPVRVVQVDDGCLRLATLHGHLETGQVRFRSYDEGGVLVFEVEAWARCASRLVQLLYAHLRLAKEIQLNMWVRFCLSAATISGGRPRDGVHITTRWVPASAIPLEPAPGPVPHDRVRDRLRR
jgi:hypothetical protein